MEERIKEAKYITSYSGMGCKIFSFVGILGTLIYVIILSFGNSNKNIYFWSLAATSLGSSISVGAIGSIAESAKRTSSLTSLIVESTNSASQLPISKEFDYSDLNEDN